MRTLYVKKVTPTELKTLWEIPTLLPGWNSERHLYVQCDIAGRINKKNPAYTAHELVEKKVVIIK